MIEKKNTLLSIAIALTLTACGGGGSGSAPATTSSGQAVDGYLSGSTVVCDASGNGVANDGEATTTTNVKNEGKFVFSPACTSTIVVSGGNDDDTGFDFRGRLKALAGSNFATPLTSLMADDGLTAAQIATFLSLDGTDVSKTNPMTNFDLHQKTLVVQQIIQQIADKLGDVPPSSSDPVIQKKAIQAIYSEVAKAVATILKADPSAKLIANGSVAKSLVSDIFTQSIKNVAANNDVAQEVKDNSKNIAVDTFATTFVAAVQNLVKATKPSELVDATKTLEPAPKNYLAILNDSLELNGATYTLGAFQSGVTLPALTASPVNTISFTVAVDGTPIPENAGVMTTQSSVAVEITEDVTNGRVLQFMLDKVDVTVVGTQLSVKVPAGAKLYAYGKTSNGTAVNKTIENITADEFIVSVDNKLTFNADKVLTRVVNGASGTPFADLQNSKGKFNLKMVVSKLSIASKTDKTAVKGLSVSVTGSGQSPVTGLGVQGIVTVQ